MWPYTEEELQRIRETLPANNADGAIMWATLAASFFLADRWGERPRPYKELSQALRASEELTRAVKALSPEALARLRAHPRPGTSDPSHPYDLAGVLPRFEHDCRLALRGLRRAVSGAPVKRDEEAWIYRLWLGWLTAHGMRPLRGWPAFRSACIEPLMNVRFEEELRPAERSERAWQSLLARARAHLSIEGARN
jgi:hypothetical protein